MVCQKQMYFIRREIRTKKVCKYLMRCRNDAIAHGEAGCVYNVSCPKTLRRAISCVRKEASSSVEREVAISNAMAKVAIPTVRNGKTSMVMEKFEKTMWDLARGRKPAAFRAEELQVIGILEYMIDNGVLHNDCHPENFGVMKNGRVVVFDFGFSIQHSITDPVAKAQALMAQLYIYTERWTAVLGPAYVAASAAHDVIYAIRRGEYTFGEHLRFI